MDRKFETLGSRLQLDPNNNLPPNAKSPSAETSPTDKVEPAGNKTVKKTNSSNSATSSTGSINTSSISTTSSTASSSSSCTTQQSQFSIFAANHVPRKTSKSDSSTNQLPSAFKLRSPEPSRKFSLSTLTSNAADRFMQRKSSLQQPQTYHQLPHQAVLPNFMGLFLAEDQQQLISSVEQPAAVTAPPTSGAAKPTGKPESIISNYLQRKASRTGQPTNTSSITNLATGATVFASCSPQPGSKKKYSEPLLPGLLREEFFLTQCLGGALDEANSSLSGLTNESSGEKDAGIAETGEQPPQKSPSHFTSVEFDMIPTIVPHLVSSTINASAASNGRRRTTLGSLIATNRPIGTVTGFRLNDSILEQQTLDTKNTLFPSQHHESHSTHQLSSMANNLYQSNFLHYLPFRRFSKRAQSDGSIGERLVHRFTYSGNRRFTLGTTADNLFQAEGEVDIVFKIPLRLSSAYRFQESF